MNDDDEPTDYTYEAWHGPTGNLLLWGPTLDDVKAKVERIFPDPTGIWVWTHGGKVYEWFGPLVTP